MTTTSVYRQAVRQAGSRFDFGGISETYDRWYETRVGRAYDALEKRAVEKMLPRPAPGGALVVDTLNAPVPINRRRKKNAGLPYAQARLFTPSALHTLLARYGKTQIRVRAFVPVAPSLVGLAFLVEPVAAALPLKDGAFIVGRVIL